LVGLVSCRSRFAGAVVETFSFTINIQAESHLMGSRAGRIKSLLLAGGLGTRLRPLTDSVPKCLIPIAGQPLLDIWVQRLVECGVQEARINTHALAEIVRVHIAQINAENSLRLVEAYEPILLGSAGTVTANVDLADDVDEIIVIYADNFSDIDLRPLIAFHRNHTDPLSMVLFEATNPSACGIAELDEEGRVISFVEKPKAPKGNLANAGLYVIDAAAYREIATMNAFDFGFEVLPRFVGRMRGWSWGGYYRDIGTRESMDRAERDARDLFSGSLPARGPEVRRPAVFLDRDGTLIEHFPYLSDPALVRLLPGAAEAIRRFRRAGFAVVLVTNQSAIGRGMLTLDRLDQIHTEMRRQLAAHGATIDGIYYCPVAPGADDRSVIEHPDRKPGPGMLLRAAADLKLDLATSWMVGDLISDVHAGLNAGCRSILLESGQTQPGDVRSLENGTLVLRDLTAAAAVILSNREAER
jgi:histidinol-phosphate phosphatase family protein